MLLDLGAKALCGQQLALRPRCFLALNPSTLSQVMLGVALVILGLFWRYLWEKITIWEVVLERHSRRASVWFWCVTYLITNNGREPNVGDFCTSEVKSWMQLLCGFFAFKSLVCLALSSFWRCVFSHCAFKISMLKSPVNVELREYVRMQTCIG